MHRQVDHSAPIGKARRGSRVLQMASAVAGRLLDTALPPACLACHAPTDRADSLCAPCWRDVTFIVPPLCDRLGLPLPYSTGDGDIMVSAAASLRDPAYARARAVAVYDGTMRRLIHDFKFRDRLDARRMFGTWLIRAGETLLADADVVVPVPLHPWRLWARRYNQAALLGREIARRADLPFAPLALTRTRATRSQVGLSEAQRRDNVARAFAVRGAARHLVAGRRVLILDDVVTTGATADAATRALRAAGADNVDVLALALVTDPTRMST
ncbi:MAG: ComF family protein [Hyphomicrobiaceae bacterium]|nr:ComF family protein [Hyphomicrobiaceae bacterium]